MAFAIESGAETGARRGLAAGLAEKVERRKLQPDGEVLIARPVQQLALLACECAKTPIHHDTTTGAIPTVAYRIQLRSSS